MIKEKETTALFEKNFGGAKGSHLYFSHGRIELLGNHTDHNHGLCLVGGVDMGITCLARKNDDNIVEIVSEGYRLVKFGIDDLTPSKEEVGTSIAITKGILYRMKEKGFLIGGFVAAMTSDIFPGAGVSSSACYEALIAKIVSDLYNQDSLSPLEMAKIGKYAENVYFGKPSGLLDQIGASFGGVSFVDFADTENPIVEKTEFDLPLSIVLVNTGGSHADLTPLYASIPADMKKVASAIFGKEVLREVGEEEFNQKINAPTPFVSERAKMRAHHFFDENQRVKRAYEALLHHDVSTFLRCVNESQLSSYALLANTMPPGQYEGSPQQGIDAALPLLNGGAVRIHGGGFAGSILAFLPFDAKESFIAKMSSYYGKENVRPVVLLQGGPARLR